MMRVKFLRDHLDHNKGDVAFIDVAQGRALCENGTCRPITTAELEAKEAQPPKNKMVETSANKSTGKTGKRRKPVTR